MIDRNPFANTSSKFLPSLDQRPTTLLILPLRNFENERRPVAGQFADEQSAALDAADLGHRALRAPVLVADPEHHGIEEGKGVVEHQPLDLAAGAAHPRPAGE